MKKRNYYFDPADPFYLAMKSEVKYAFTRGYSVVELQRLLGHSTSKYLYVMLREEGAIETLPRKRQRKYKLPDLFVGGLEKCGLGFLQWCNSHSLHPDFTEEVLSSPEVKSEPSSVLAHRAFRRDFPHIYKRIYEDAQYIPPAREKKPEKRNRDGVNIRFDASTLRYVATVVEKPDCVAEGDSYDEAFVRLKYRCAAYTSLIKLQLLPDRSEEPLPEEVFDDCENL